MVCGGCDESETGSTVVVIEASGDDFTIPPVMERPALADQLGVVGLKVGELMGQGLHQEGLRDGTREPADLPGGEARDDIRAPVEVRVVT